MKRIFALLTKRWMTALLRLIALLALVWFLGPYVSVAGWEPLGTPARRWLASLGLVVLWSLNQFRIFWVERRRNQQMMQGLLRTPTPPPPEGGERAAEEIETLRQRMEEALNTLKRVKAVGWRWYSNYLYQLPWYIFIGPPGSGKTTALRASGLRFPLEEQLGDTEIKGIGGTRNCDWIFTDEAVLLDTAGRYVTQDSEPEADRVAWLGFLKLLKKHRPRQPINGIFAVISMRDVLQQSDEERADHAYKIKQRIRELNENLSILAPIYVLFTKCDLIAGFTEFFGNLGREERAQVWGMTFPLETQSPETVRMFTQEFELLEQSLNARLPERLQEETDPRRRDLIYTFPQEFSAIRPVAQAFLNSIFEHSRFEAPFILRGVYFTSGTQVGNPIDRLMGSIADAFGVSRSALPAFSGRGKSYFLERLLKDVVFREAALVGTDIRLERRQAWLRRAAYAGAVIVAVLTLGAWWASYIRNLGLIHKVEDEIPLLKAEIGALTPGRSSVIDVLPALDRARGMPGGYGDTDGGRFSLLGFGLNERDKLGAAAEETYEQLLMKAFLPRLMLRMEDTLRRSSGDLDALREALEVYLMLDDPKRFDGAAVKNWVVSDWRVSLPSSVTREQRARLDTHLQALVKRPSVQPPIALDKRLIAQSRERLAQIPLAERVYQRVKQSTRVRELPEFRVSDAAGRDAPRVFARKSEKPLSHGIAGLYTYKGYAVFTQEAEHQFEQTEARAWVFGGERELDMAAIDRQSLIQEITRLYLNEFTQVWIDLLSDVTVVPFTSLDQAVEVLRLLSEQESSPLKRLLEAVANETMLIREEETPSGAKQGAAQDFWNSMAERIKAVIPSSAREQEAAGEVAAASLEIRQHPLQEIHDFVRGTDKNPPPLEAVLKSLYDLYIQVDAIASAVQGGSGVPPDLKAKLDGVVAQIQREARGRPAMVRNLLERVSKNSQLLAESGQYKRLNAAWMSDVLPFYRQAIAGRYPLVRSSLHEVTLDDFARFFGPGGIVESFFQQHLQDLVDTSAKVWRVRPGQQGVGVSAETLRQFQRAGEIRKAFFGGGQSPVVSFQLKPIVLDADVNQFLLEVDGQQVSYSHGPTVVQSLKWPGPGDLKQARIQFSATSASDRNARTEDGPWAWFRILDMAKIEGTSQPERFIATFEVGGHRATYEIRASSAFNPFRAIFIDRVLERFHCPPAL